jgi:hypothetical protein
MDDRIKRLCILLAAAAFVAFGGAALFSTYRASSYQDAVTIWYQNLNRAIAECEADRESIYCEAIPSNRNYFNESVAERNNWSALAEKLSIASFVVPALIVFLFFSARWVLTGRLRSQSTSCAKVEHTENRNKHKVAEFSAHYQSLNEGELADLHDRASSLTEEARMALDAVITNRGIDPEKMRQEAMKEDLDYIAKETVREEERKKRDARHTKIWIAISIPIVVLGMIFRPERTYETLISTITQVLVIVFAAWVVLAIKRSLSRRKR